MGTLNIDLLMGIPRAVEFIVYITCAIMIYRKRDYYLNKIYGVSLLGWVIYVLCDAFIFPIGHIEPWFWGTMPGNPAELLPLVANILRDILIVGACITAFGYLYASVVIRYGEAKAKEKKLVIFFLSGIIITASLISIFDIIIKDISEIPYTVSTTYNIMSILFILIELIIYGIAIYQHYEVYKEIDKNKPEKRKILFFILGSTFIAAGVIYFVLAGLLLSSIPQIIRGTIGHSIWILSPIFIYYGIKKT